MTSQGPQFRPHLYQTFIETNHDSFVFRNKMSLAFDENGRPFIILREQEKKKRVKGLEAHKVIRSF